MEGAAWDNKSDFRLLFNFEVRNFLKIARIAIWNWLSLPPSVSPRRDVQNGIGFIIPGWSLAPNKRESTIFVQITVFLFVLTFPAFPYHHRVFPYKDIRCLVFLLAVATPGFWGRIRAREQNRNRHMKSEGFEQFLSFSLLKYKVFENPNKMLSSSLFIQLLAVWGYQANINQTSKSRVVINYTLWGISREIVTFLSFFYAFEQRTPALDQQACTNHGR